MVISTKNFTFRKCTEEDYDFVYTLFKRNMYDLFMKNYGSWKPEVFRKDFNKKNITILERNERRVAFYDLEFQEHNA